MSLLLLSCFCLTLGITVSAQDVVSLSASPKATNAPGISQIISPSFAGMGIEPSNLYSFTGGQNNPNTLSINLLNNLANYTGVPPHLRIGGNTQDNMIYDASYDNYDLETNPSPIGEGNYPSDLYIFGPRFFEVLNRFPAGTPITYGLNMAYQDGSYGGYIDRIVAEAQAALTGLTNLNLVSYEIGNEPDLYAQNGFRNGTWNNTIYGPQWEERAAAVYQQVLRPAGIGSNFFEPGCTASTIGTTFQIFQLAQTPITQIANATTNTSYVAAWNQHDYYYYVGVSGYTLTLERFMDLSQTYAQFASWVQQATSAYNIGYPYVLREMASAGPTGLQGLSDIFGATLWQLNFFLWTATLNISSVQMHMTDNSFAAPWQPIEYYNTAPFVRTTYYAWAAMDQLIGPGCSTQVASVNINGFPEGYANNLAAYATYQSGNLAALVLINTKVANISESNKGSISFAFSFPSLAGQTLYLSYLTADGTDATSNTTWNGLSYEQSGDGTPTRVSSTTDTATIGTDGSVSISVRDAQAVVANLGSVVGSQASANADACKALATSQPIPSETYTAPVASAPAASATGAAAAAQVTSVSSTNVGAAGPDVTASSGGTATSKAGAAPALSPPIGTSYFPMVVLAMAFVGGVFVRYA